MAIYQPVGAGVGGLADIAPTLDWVRLAQRFPVRIILEAPPDCSPRSGSTATVRINPGQRVGVTRDGILAGGDFHEQAP